MKKTGAQIICEGLIEEGTEVIFGFPGGVILPFYDTLPQYPQLRHILVRHEQGAPPFRCFCRFMIPCLNIPSFAISWCVMNRVPPMRLMATRGLRGR